MLCPYCQKEMMPGSIWSGKTDITWSPMGVKHGMFINQVKEGQVQLARMRLFHGAKVEAYRCPDCKKIIIHG